MNWTTRFLVSLVVMGVFAMATCQFLADQTKDPEVTIDAEWWEPFTVDSYFDTSQPEIYWLGYKIGVLNINDTFSLTINNFYAEKLSVMWLGAGQDIQLLHKTFGGRGTHYKYIYKAIGDTTFQCVLRMQLSDSQVLLRAYLGRNVSTNNFLTPIFALVFALCLLIERADTKLPAIQKNKKLPLKSFLMRLWKPAELELPDVQEDIHAEIRREARRKQRQSTLSRAKRSTKHFLVWVVLFVIFFVVGMCLGILYLALGGPSFV